MKTLKMDSLESAILDNFESIDIFKTFYQAWVDSGKKSLEACFDTTCRDCVYSRYHYKLKPIEKSGYDSCRGTIRHIDLYEAYDLSPIKLFEDKVDDKPETDTGIVHYENGGMKEVSKDGEVKTMFQLFDPNFYEGVCKILTHGAIKYSADNWQKVPREEYERAVESHYTEYKKGNKLDGGEKGSGLSHLYHVACNLMFLDWFDRQEEEEECK